jgi:ribosome-associated protein
MQTFKLREKDEYITLGQLLKAAGFADNGVMAKEMVQDGRALVNGEEDLRRGRKLYAGDVVKVDGTEIQIVR